MNIDLCVGVGHKWLIKFEIFKAFRMLIRGNWSFPGFDIVVNEMSLLRSWSFPGLDVVAIKMSLLRSYAIKP